MIKKTVLAIWPHPDDIELWCFWTMCKFSDLWYKVCFLVLSKWEWSSVDWDRVEEAKKSSKLLKCELYVENLPDMYMSSWPDTIQVLEKHIKNLNPDMVFIPSWNDTHQDHRAVNKAALVASRLIDEIYIYQSPSTTMDFKPSIYFDVSKYIEKKIEAVKIHSTQWWKVYMAERAVKGLAQYRAFDIFRNDKYMEAFEIFRIIK